MTSIFPLALSRVLNPTVSQRKFLPFLEKGGESKVPMILTIDPSFDASRTLTHLL